ncbi:hypothetical protein GCM10009836_37010 [Pseudonocardia ailaonensis]|uniref:Transposase IS116/IS110/IS902 family protein n=1 Tax=Pseudonocardia ailaonensis TaxID=367279 RepID=A0ABN2N5E5_9PSEU
MCGPAPGEEGGADDNDGGRLDADRLPLPRADGDRKALRILLGARRELTTYRRRMIIRLRALLLTGDDSDRTLARGPMSPPRLTTLARRRGIRGETREQAVQRAKAHRLALAIRDSGIELKDNKTQLRELVGELAPALMDKVGVGPVSAAQAIVSCRTEAAAATTPPSPPWPERARSRPAAVGSSDIVLTRWRICPRTHASIAKRRAEGKADNEIRRLLKRYIVREIYRCLQTEIAA